MSGQNILEKSKNLSMKWENSIGLAISFFIGCLACYISLQYSYFQIKKELDVPSIIISIVTLLIGLFIALTIQKRVTKGQNNHSFLVNKIDKLWTAFNEFAEGLSYEDRVDITTLKNFIKNVVHPVSSLNKVFNSFEIESKCVSDLEENLDNFETMLSNIPANQNVIDISNNRVDIEAKILEINRCFGLTLRQIQNI
jgi:hypothetical protein